MGIGTEESLCFDVDFLGKWLAYKITFFLPNVVDNIFKGVLEVTRIKNTPFKS